MELETLRYTRDDPYGRNKPVYVLDDIVVKAGRQDSMMALMNEEYLPLAHERGMELTGVWLFPPFEQADKPSSIVYLWRFDTLEHWWKARADEENDARLPAFWRRAEDFLVSRTRRLGRPPSLMTSVEPDPLRVSAFKALAAGSRRIAIVKPRDELGEQDRNGWVAAAQALINVEGIRFSTAGFHTDYSFLPGQMTWDIVGAPELPISDSLLLSHLPGPADISELVVLDTAISAGFREPVGAVRQKRTVLLRASDNICADDRENLEKTLLKLVRQIEGIRTWSVSRVLRAKGNVPWTHCFEQEFRDPQVLTTDYLDHPYHWAVADRLFGPEGPEKVVNEFVHTMRAADDSMFSAIEDGRFGQE